MPTNQVSVASADCPRGLYEFHFAHLAGKVDRAQLDYRPTAKQRSTLELLQYLAVMGPVQVKLVIVNVIAMNIAPLPELLGKSGRCRQSIDEARVR